MEGALCLVKGVLATTAKCHAAYAAAAENHGQAKRVVDDRLLALEASDSAGRIQWDFLRGLVQGLVPFVRGQWLMPGLERACASPPPPEARHCQSRERNCLSRGERETVRRSTATEVRSCNSCAVTGPLWHDGSRPALRDSPMARV